MISKHHSELHYIEEYITEKYGVGLKLLVFISVCKLKYEVSNLILDKSGLYFLIVLKWY